MIRRAPMPAWTHSPIAAEACSTEEAFAHCERIARNHYENFPVASRFVPEYLRPYLWAVYAFVRTADDFADEPIHAGRRDELLSDWEEQLESCFHGEASHPIFIALREAAERRDLPISPLRDLLTAARMDLVTPRHPTFESLRSYSTYAAQPIGRLVLYIFDYRDAGLHRASDDLCTALHLAHILQDLDRDLERGRIYLPEEDLAHFQVRESDLGAGRVTSAFRDLMRFQIARTRALFERARPLCSWVGRDLGFELNLIWQGGMRLLDKIEATDYDVFHRRPVLTRTDELRLVAISAARRWPLLYYP